ncbi:hypothetical protein Bca4012_088941 [Brassica carinata]
MRKHHSSPNKSCSPNNIITPYNVAFPWKSACEKIYDGGGVCSLDSRRGRVEVAGVQSQMLWLLRNLFQSRFLVDFAAGGGGDKVQFSDRGFAVVDLAITEKRQELLDAGGDGPVVLFMSLWSCPSDNSTVVVVYGLTIFSPPLLSVHVFPTSALLHVLEFRRRSTSGSVLVFVDVPFSALTLEFRSYMSQVLSFGSQRQQMSEQPRSVGSYLFGVIFWSSTYPSAGSVT